jgi:hypothetical protein
LSISAFVRTGTSRGSLKSRINSMSASDILSLPRGGVLNPPRASLLLLRVFATSVFSGDMGRNCLLLFFLGGPQSLARECSTLCGSGPPDNSAFTTSQKSAQAGFCTEIFD